MTYEFKCENPDCNQVNEVVSRNIPYDEVENQHCDECNNNLKRIWSFNGGISTSDGFKN